MSKRNLNIAGWKMWQHGFPDSRWTVIEKLKNGEWLCECSCDKHTRRAFDRYYILSGASKSCGCSRKKNTYDLSGEYGIGYTSSGKEFYFDLEDYEKIKDYCWYISDGYACSKDKECISLHRLVMNAKPNEFVDHDDRKRNDSRKANLRIVSRTQNNQNKSLRSDNKSGITGVSYRKDRHAWTSRIRIDGKYLHLGNFHDFDDAVVARLKAEKEYFGDFAPQRDLFEKYNI